MITEAVQDGLRRRFEHARALKSHPTNDIVAGRRFIAEYVPFIHYVERLHQAATGPVDGHQVDEPSIGTHEH